MDRSHTTIRIVFSLICCLLLMGAGCEERHVAPTPAVSTPPPPNKDYTEVPEWLEGLDVAKIIGIETEAQLRERRAALVRFFWPDGKLPGLLPRFRATKEPRVREFQVDLDFGLKSRGAFFESPEPNGELVLYHEGHFHHFNERMALINLLLRRGYSVMAFNTLLHANNNRPRVETKRFGPMVLNSHDKFRYLSDAPNANLHLFMDPLVAGVNYAKSKGFKKVHLVGFSGGGWATTVYAALDPRIIRSCSVAGTLPLMMRRFPSESGDLEQVYAPLYQAANYFQMYVLCAAGQGRSHLQIYNQFDDTSFYGLRFRVYEGPVAEAVARAGGGEFAVWLDTETRTHTISGVSNDRILEFLTKP